MTTEPLSNEKRITELEAKVDALASALFEHETGTPFIQSGVIDIDAGKAAADDVGAFVAVAFPKPFPAGSSVVVVPFVMTFNGADSPGLRITEVTGSGFKVRMNELVASGKRLSDASHTTETIGWVAVQQRPPEVMRSGYGVMALTMK